MLGYVHLLPETRPALERRTVAGTALWVLEGDLDGGLLPRRRLRRWTRRLAECGVSHAALPPGREAEFAPIRPVLPDGLREIGRGNFAESSLRSIRVPASVEKIGEYAFTGGFALKRIDVAPENRYYQSIDGVLYTKDGTELLACPPRKWGYLCLPETVQILRGGAFLNSCLSELRFTGNSLTAIERNAFCHCMYLRKLWFPASLQWMEEGSVQKNPALREIYFFGDVPRTVRSDGTDASYFSAISAFDMPANVYYLPEKHGFDTFEGALLNPIPVDEITVDPIQSCGDGAIWWYSENGAAEGELTIRALPSLTRL